MAPDPSGDARPHGLSWSRPAGHPGRAPEKERLKLLGSPGVPYVPYYGYGAGIVRLSLGDNMESGGPYRSSYHQWLFLTDATVRANGRPVIERGELVVA